MVAYMCVDKLGYVVHHAQIVSMQNVALNLLKTILLFYAFRFEPEAVRYLLRLTG